jgi:3-dehydroquinate synthase
VREIKVRAEREYTVKVDCSWQTQLAQILVDRKRAAVIVSESMRERLPDFDNLNPEVAIFAIPDGEAGKSQATLLQLWNWLGAAGFTKSDLLIGIGGGAVTDITGYVAASWLRGIDWLAIPTTVAGAVDAAIGGKTAINSEYGKNLIGAFHSPISVFIDFQWFETLSDRDFAAGLAEVVKTGFIADGEILKKVIGLPIAQIRGDRELVIDLVERTIAVKAEVVSEDFKESFHREILNYGHTLGHAVELDTNFELRHGECVSIGMAFMARLQEDLGLINSDLAQLHFDILQGLGLPTVYKRTAWPKILGHMKLDKKSRSGALRFVTIRGVGEVDRLESPDEELLFRAYEKVSK